MLRSLFDMQYIFFLFFLKYLNNFNRNINLYEFNTPLVEIVGFKITRQSEFFISL